MARVRLAKVVRNLPRRAHELSRATVAESQRWRLIEAIVEVSARDGYAETSVASVIERAGVSRKTFYEHFDDKEDCFLTAYDVVSDRLIADLVAASAGHKTQDARRTAQVTRFLEVLAAEPAGARVFMVDVLGAGPRALKRREDVNRRFADALYGDASVDAVRRAATVGGVNNVVASALIAGGKGRELLQLAGSLSDFVRSALK